MFSYNFFVYSIETFGSECILDFHFEVEIVGCQDLSAD